VTSAYRNARTYLRMFVNLNVMIHALLFHMTTNIIVNVMMYVMCRKDWICWVRTTTNGG
jgi:hypothetical protein